MSKDMGRRSFLKFAGGAVGISALSYYLGTTNRVEPTLENSLPEYADNGLGFPAFRGPYRQKDARLAAFFFNADHESLATLCDRTLNVSESFNYKYVPLTSSVMLVFADMLVSSRDERDKEVGLIPETEASFWVLTVAMQNTQSGLVPHHLAWFLPYLLVDESNAIATGREVFGFNKLAADFQKPAKIQEPDFTATVLGFRQFGADMIAQREQLLSLSSSPADVAKTGNLHQIKNTMSAELLRNVQSGPGGGLLEFAARFINDHIPLVFLKQFRDAQNTHKACYQRIIEAPLKVENFFEGGIILNSYTLNIAALASHPLAQNLGLKAEEQKSTLGAWMQVDFVLENGMEI
ncbi:MAG TPA: hypothetical protein VFD54_12080 [Anaerolineales bacterium]|jgi:hypothetical protein|nr:hypothetical protein [Anaerolineales bacterium]